MTIELEKELREGLERASKGRWKHFRRNGVNEVQHGRSNVPVVAWAGFDDSSRAEKDHAANAAYIVAAQPDNIRALLSEIERLRERERRATEVIVGLVGESSPLEKILFGDMDEAKSCNFTAPLSRLRAARAFLNDRTSKEGDHG